MNSVMTTVETRVQDAILTVTKKLVFPSVEQAIKSVNAFSGPNEKSTVPDPDQKDFSGRIEDLQ